MKSVLILGRAFLATVVLVMLLALSGCLPASPNAIQINLSDAISLSQNHNLSSATIDNGRGVISMTATVSGAVPELTDTSGNKIDIVNGTQMESAIGTLNLSELQQMGFVLPPKFSAVATSSGSSLAGILLTIILPIGFFILLMFFLFRAGRGAQSQAISFSRSKARLLTGNRPHVTFADVAGADEAKEDLQEVVKFLKDRWKFQSIGAVIPKGVLVVGPPGTGKTLLARAVAGEAGVPFFSVSGSEFVEMFVGVGAARVRDLFDQAKHNAPCIVFIDEIDAVGRQRSGSIPGSHEEREQTLNQILVEMDGFDPNIGVIVLAATNRPDVLDPALLRPGRFDRRVVLDRPDTNGRAAILTLHAKGKPLEPSVDLATVAKQTHGFNGADLANLLNEAAILAVRRNKTAIGMKELEEAIDRVIAGPERKNLRINPRDRETTAYHEAGHALVAHLLPNVDPVHKISIVARGSMGGYTRLLTEDRYFMTASQFKDTLSVLAAGHASEELVFSEVSTGPHSDIKQATELARRMVTDYGMSKKLGLRTYGRQVGLAYLGGASTEERDYSEETARQIDGEVTKLIDDAHQIAKDILLKNRPRLAHLAEKLLVTETLEGAELEAAFTEPLTASPSADPASPGNPAAIAPPAGASSKTHAPHAGVRKPAPGTTAPSPSAT